MTRQELLDALTVERFTPPPAPPAPAAAARPAVDQRLDAAAGRRRLMVATVEAERIAGHCLACGRLVVDLDSPCPVCAEHRTGRGIHPVTQGVNAS